jgi:MFS family permease
MQNLPAPAARRAVRRLAFARLISLAGTDASAIAVSFGLFAQTGSVRWLSASLLVMFGLGALVAPVAGMLADRFDRLRLMLGADLVAVGVFAAMAFAHRPVALLSLCVVATVAGSIHGPAAAAAIPSVAGEEHLSWANGLLAVGGNIGKTAGRLAGGVLVAALGVGAVFAIDALTFAVSAALTWSVRGAVAPALRMAADAARDEEPVRGGRAGWAALAADPVLRLVIGSSCLATLMTSFTMTAEAPLATAFSAGPAGLGALAASWSLGMVAGSALAARLLDADNEPAGLFGGRLLMGAGIASVALAPVFWPTLLSYVVGGLAGGFLLVAAQSLIQRSASESTRGRALAAAEGAKTAAFGVGVLAAGSVVELLGPQVTYAFVGAGVLLSALPLARLVVPRGPIARAPAHAPAVG